MGKIFLVATAYVPNTAPANRYLGFVRAFSDLGFEVKLVYFISDGKRSHIPIEYPHVKVNYMWEKFPITNRYLSQIQYEYNACKFIHSLKKDDIVFVMGLSRILFKLLKKRGIHVFHERTEHPEAYSQRTFNNNRYKRKIYKLDGLYVISTALKRYFIKLGMPEYKIHIINMIVDNNRFKGLVKQPSERYIAYCGTASNNKDGVDELIKSFAIVHELHPDVKLYIIGKTPDKEDRAGNLKLVEKLGIKDSVIFTGIISSEQMPQVLKNAEILALDRPDSLQAQHGFPTKLGEYLLTENPVVVTKVGDIPLFLTDGVTALLSEERNSQEFSNKLNWALDNPDKASEIGKRGAELARKEFNYLNETKKIIKSFGI